MAVTVTASGKMFPPTKRGGRIEREFRNYPEGARYDVQDRAWMDEHTMKKWVDDVLIPYCETAPAGIHPLIILDSYRCHMMKSIVNRIQDAGIQVEHIPGGCTSLCQPIDVGIGKPLKDCLRGVWEHWMLEHDPDTSIFRPPSRELLSGWIVETLRSMPAQLVRNSWCHAEYTYFPIDNLENETTETNIE